MVKYLVNRTAYDETTAWCYVPQCLKPLRRLFLSLVLLLAFIIGSIPILCCTTTDLEIFGVAFVRALIGGVFELVRGLRNSI